VVDEIIQRGLVWTFEIRDWWILTISETFEQKVLKRAILGIFYKIFQKYFVAVFRAY